MQPYNKSNIENWSAKVRSVVNKTKFLVKKKSFGNGLYRKAHVVAQVTYINCGFLKTMLYLLIGIPVHSSDIRLLTSPRKR